MADLTFRPYPPPIDLLEVQRKIDEIKAKPVWKPEYPNYASLILTVRIFRDYGDGWMDVCDDDGNCLKVSKNLLLKPILEYQNEEERMKSMKAACLKVAKDLAKANNTITTLEIKLELRRDYGYYYWTQQVVSDFMNQFAGDGIFTYVDNGTYRIYSLASPTAVAATAGPVSSSLSGISKVAGKTAIAVAPAPRRGGRKRSYVVISNTMTRSAAIAEIQSGNFDNVTIGTDVITPADIRSQKKSPKGYLTAAKASRINEITVAGKVYIVS